VIQLKKRSLYYTEKRGSSQGFKGDYEGQVAAGGGGLFADDEFAVLVLRIPFVHRFAGVIDLPLRSG
jgi:hypothetical protein